jgi:hypothetical protein
MVIDENDAFQLFQGIETMPEDMRPRAASLLADYKAQQESLGAPLWPTQEKLKQDRKKRVQEVFNNPLVLDSDNGAFVEANKVKPGLGDNLRAREASILWLADRYNADESDVRKRYDFYKADQSQKWGVQSLDDSTFFGKAKSELDADTLRIEKRKQSALTGMESALSGATMASELARFQESYPDATEDEKLTFADTLFQTSVVLLPHRKLIDSAAPAMRRIQQGQGTNEDRQTIENLTWRLAQSTGRERQILTRSLLMGAKKVAEEGGKRDVSGTFAGSAVNLIESMFGAGRRGEELSRRIDPNQPLPIAGPIASVEDALKAMDDMARADIASRVPYDPNAPKLPAARALSDDEKAFVIEAKERVKSLFKAERELKKIALSTDPMDDSILGTMASGAASSLALMLPLAMGPQGLLMAGGGYANLEREELLTEFPDMNPDDAGTISVLSGAAQAAMDKATLFGLGKFAPNVRKMIMGGVTKELVKKATAQGAALFAFENTVEAAQDLSTSVIQTMVSELSQTVPQVDWQKEKDEFLGTRADVAIGMIPLMLIGAGVNTAANKQQINKMLSDNDLMMRVGIIQEDRVKILELSTAGKTNEAEAALQDAMGRRSPELAAEVADRYASKLDSLRKVQDQISTLDITSPEYTVSVTRSPTGWQVTTGEGTIIPVDSVEAANQIYSKLRQVGSQQEADALVSVIDGYYEQGRQAETVFTGETVQASDVEAVGVVATRRDAGGGIISQRQLGPQALETVRAEAEVAGIKSGTQGIFAHINGSNEVFPMRVADGAKEIVRRMNLYKSQAEGQPQVFTFLHENFESTWRLGIENGTFSDQETRTAMRALLPAFEGVTALNAEEAQFIDNLRTLASGKGNETMLRETVSEMVMRDVLGRDRQGLATGMEPGSISRAIEASVMGANTQEEASALKRILAVFRAFSAYLKGVFGTVDAITKARDEGKLGEEYDTFINKVLGIDEVKQMEGEAIDEAKAMLGVDEEAQAVIDAGNMMFSISPIRNLNELSDQVERNFAENPAGALEVKSKVIRQFAKLADKWSNERWTPQGNKIRPISEKRTVKSLDKEQAMRQAQREVELVNEGMDKLTPDTLMAYSEGVGTLEDDPLVKKMLHDNGRLMSKATAAREGRDIKDQYDDLNWIPPQWYSNGRTIKTVVITRKDGSSESFPSAKVPAEIKAAIKSGEVKVKINKVTIPAVGGIMPDVMANNLGFDTASEMWAALESSIKSHRNAKADYAKAEAAVKAVEKAAFEQARQEAQAWRDEADAMQKEDWSPRESLVRDLITLEAIVAMFPQEIRGKIGGFVTLARKASESARLKVLQRQLERGQELLEKHLKEQYNTAILDLLDKAVPVGKPGEVKKSKFIVTVQDELDSISELVGMDNDDVSSMIATTEAAIIAANNAEEADAALTQLNLLELFGGILDIKNTSSQELEAAHAYLDSLMKQGREARKMLDEARRERVKEMVTNAKRDAFKGQTGPETTQAARSAAAKKSGKSMLKKFFNELSGFDAVLRDAFGPKSKTATEFSERFTLNSNQFEDVQNERRKRFRDFARDLYRTKLGAVINQKLIKLERIENNSGVTYLKNREVETHKFTEEQAARIVADPKAFGFTEKDAAAISEEIQAIQNARGRRKVFTYEQVKNEGDRVEIPLSQMDALYLSMALRQPGILEQQQRYGYNQETVDQLEVFLTDDSKAWRRWMQSEYDAEYQRANEVYMRMFNTRMPMIMFYAPLLKNHQGQQAILDPLNTGISSNSANPGSIKSRKARTSSLRIESALSVFWSHFNQMEHWIANAEYLRDVQSVMLNPEVREAVVSAHGDDGMATISAWVQLQMSRGVGKAALATAGNKMFRNVKSAISMKALALSYTTTLKTLPSVFYSLGEIHMSKWPAALASGMKHWDRLWKTNIIQRRLDIGGMPELRDLGSSALPMSWVNQGIRYGSYPTMYADGVFTTYSAAMAYGTSFDDAKRQGASDEVAHQYAEERTALIVSKTAQPENWTQKSLFENDVSGAGGLFVMFMSDPRQKMALTGEALNQWRKGSATTEEAMRKFLAYWVIPGVIFQLANAIGRSVFKGDDDEWEVVDFATAALVGQLQGFLLIGSAVEMIFSAAIAAVAEKMTGEEVKKKPFWNSPKNPLDQAAQELVKSVEKITKEEGDDGMGKAWQVMKSAGMLLTPFTPAGAIPSTAERVMKDTTNLFYDDGE